MLEQITDEIIGLGPLEPLLRDGSISDILVNTHTQVFVERGGILEQVATGFQEAIRARQPQAAEVRIAKAVNANISPRAMGRGQTVSGFDTLRTDDYDIPTFFRSKD